MDCEESDGTKIIKVKSKEGKIFEANLDQLKMCGKKTI